MFKKILAALAAVLLGAGLSVVAVAAPASAHTGALTGVAACQGDGTFTVTWTYNQTNTPSEGDGSQADVEVTAWGPDGSVDQTWLNVTTANSAAHPGVAVRTGNWSQQFTQTGIPGSATEATATVLTTWLGWGEPTNSYGTVSLAGDCAPPPPTDVCPNIEGPQSVIPDGMSLDVNGNCVTTPPPPPTCVENPTYSYTYTQAANGGVITVTGDPQVKLCNDFYVTVATWSFQQPNNVWSQTLEQTQKLHIEYPGDYPYGLPVQCGQGDVYASFESQPEPPLQLDGPDNPWDEQFLHEMAGFTGPDPTYIQTAPGCNAVVPAVPSATKADTCGEYGTLVVPADDQYFHYTVTGGKDGLGKEGVVTVTATVQPPYVVGLVEGDPAVTEWELDLGFLEECVDPCALVEGDAETEAAPLIVGPTCATAVVEVTKPTCFAAAQLVLGAVENATWGPVTDPPGANNYSVTATADEDATFEGGLTELTFEGILDPKLPADDPACQLTDLDLVLPAVSFTNGTCSTDGSYTLGAAPGFNPAHLTWIVNGTPAANGTYPVSTTTDLELVAVAVAPHGIDPEWANPVLHTVTVPATVCGELSTLALTGSGGQSGALAFAGGILLLGILATVRARRGVVR